MKRLLATAAVVLIAAAATLYVRPLAVFSTVRHAWLLVNGFRGGNVLVSGHRIHYLAAGNGPPLVAIHGLGSRGEDWAPLLPDLARTHRVYAIDLLGYGGSDRPRNADYSIASEAEVVRGFFDAMPIARADVVAVSMGGWVALKFAAAHPERIRKLVLFDSAGIAFPASLTADSFAPHDIAELRKLIALQTDRAGLLPGFVARDFLRENRKHAWVLQAQMRSMLSGRDLMDGRLGSVPMPVLIFWGTNDRMIPPAVGQRLAQELPDARLVPLRGCGHLAVVECRAEAMPVIDVFLRTP